MDCLSKPKSAVSHSAKAHYVEKQFNWTAPAGLKDNVRFRATIVHKKEVFWENVFSIMMTYDVSEEITSNTSSTTANTTTNSTTTVTDTTTHITVATTTTAPSEAATLATNLLAMAIFIIFLLH
ncbi:unnamed protein product [Owenia fusiformis]|uniref:Uncharacterized protein n=1 Tax=Owenia fusiformis TaxID=6347 RepID=A0A8J1TVB2_OWEFU|nr:unnamed protein product [Owenia fusiformis]